MHQPFLSNVVSPRSHLEPGQNATLSARSLGASFECNPVANYPDGGGLTHVPDLAKLVPHYCRINA
jgi:hypothetical protein